MSSFLWLAAVTGALSLLTPCVFPMIPVTATYFSQVSYRGRAWVLQNALLFAGGIVVTFTGLGLALAFLVGASGLARLAANPWLNIAIGISFVAFALNLMGLWELRLPFVTRAAGGADSSARARSGTGTASFLMGFSFTLASFTCTAPFVGPLLVSAARGDWPRPLVGMLTFSVVFSAPFFLLATAPGWMHHLPRPGRWMVEIRTIVGLVELGVAIKFFSNADLVLRTGIISRAAIVLFWAAVVVAVAMYLARPLLGFRMQRNFSVVRSLTVIACLVIAGWIARGVQTPSLGELEAFLPPQDITESGTSALASGSVNGSTRAQWILNNHSAALKKARETGKLVLIDFTGYTCTNCRWMEAKMFARPDVNAALGNFVLSRLYTDGEGEIYERQQAFQEREFGTVALPLYAIVDGNGRIVRTFAGLTRKPAEFLAFLGTLS